MTSGSSISDWVPALALISAFLMGSVPFGLWIARAFKVRDLTSRGSGNIGATNVSRVVGFWPAGFLTLLLDSFKGALPILVCIPVGVSLWAPWLQLEGLEFSMPLLWGLGLAAVLGHCFSPWLRFRGGKGVATGFGALAVLSPGAAAVGLIAFGLAFLARRIGSMASLAGLFSAAAAHLVIHGVRGTHLVFGALLVFVVLFRHESNIDALLQEKERGF